MDDFVRPGAIAADRAAWMDSRRHPRAPVGLHLSLRIAGASGRVPGVLKDISESGCFFVTTAPVEVGWTVSLCFEVDARGPCEAYGMVVRAPKGEGFAVEFDHLGAGLKRLVWMLVAATSDAQRLSVLRAVRDADIEVGYLRGPRGRAASGAIAAGLPADPGCPTCGGPLAWPRVVDAARPASQSCLRCSVAFALRPPDPPAAASSRSRRRGRWLWIALVALAAIGVAGARMQAAKSTSAPGVAAPLKGGSPSTEDIFL